MLLAVCCRGGRGAQVSRLLALHAYLHGEPTSKPDAAAAAARQAANRKADNEDLASKVGHERVPHSPHAPDRIELFFGSPWASASFSYAPDKIELL